MLGQEILRVPVDNLIEIERNTGELENWQDFMASFVNLHYENLWRKWALEEMLPSHFPYLNRIFGTAQSQPSTNTVICYVTFFEALRV